MSVYGQELILDLKNCDPQTFNRKSLKSYFVQLCEKINMELCEVYFWDDVGVPEAEKQTNPKTKGTTAVAFIITSNITVHTLDDLKAVYINVFSCKDFNTWDAIRFSEYWFHAEVPASVHNLIERT